jgi:hypothetical protein
MRLRQIKTGASKNIDIITVVQQKIIVVDGRLVLFQGWIQNADVGGTVCVTDFLPGNYVG